jgi:hypothetical protein
MNRYFLIILISLFVGASAYASTMYCKVDTAYVCTDNGCSEVKSNIFVNLDTERNTYQRGDDKGIDTYEMNIYKSGTFVVAEIPGSATLKIDTQDDLKFVEVVQLGLKTWNNFGKCKVNN